MAGRSMIMCVERDIPGQSLQENGKRGHRPRVAVSRPEPNAVCPRTKASAIRRHEGRNTSATTTCI